MYFLIEWEIVDQLQTLQMIYDLRGKKIIRFLLSYCSVGTRSRVGCVERHAFRTACSDSSLLKKNESRTFRNKKQSPERSIKCAIEVVNVLI